MQVKDLIEQLRFMNPDAEVHFSYNYGDHWRTEVAPTVDSVTEGVVKYSDYHRMDKLMDEDEMIEDEGDFEGTRRVVVIS
jgi:hypothetical protein